MQVKDWLFVIGVGVILLGAVGVLDEERGAFPVTRRKSMSGIHAGYSFAVVDLLCAVNLLDVRRGLVALGLSEALSWVLAPIGLIVVIAASMVSWGTAFGEDEGVRWWVWLGALTVYLGAGASYIGISIH